MKQNKGFFNKKSDISLSQDITKPKTQFNLTPKTSHKKLKIFGATTLAVFMSATALFAFLPLTQTKISARPSNLTAEAVKLTPETDPVVYTTDDGIEIKSHTVSATGSESTIQYFTLGSYNGTPVNWLIVGVSSSSWLSDLSPAGIAINEDNASQKLVMGGMSSDLKTNQLLCISEYAFNQETYNPNCIVSTTVTYTCTDYSFSQYSATTNEFSDYYKSCNLNHISYVSNFGSILEIDRYYGSDSGKIVVNSNFSNNYVFLLSSSNYITFVSSTNYKIPYLFTAKTTSSNAYTNNMGITGTVTSFCECYNPGNWYLTVTGSGAATGYLVDYINNSGTCSTNYNIATFTATSTSLNSYYQATHNNSRAYHYSTTYSVTNYTITLAYRPAFIWQL